MNKTELMSETSQIKLNAIRNSGKFCCVTIESDYMYVWDISLKESSSNDSKHEVKWRSGSYEDLNDAVTSIYSQVENLIK